MTRSRAAWLKFFLTRFTGLVVDVIALGAAYFAAFLLRFDFCEPRWGWGVVAFSFLTVAAVYLLFLFACGCYRLSWRRIHLRDVPRFALAAAFATVLLTILRLVTPVESYMHLRPPYSVSIVFFVLATVALVSWRALWSWLSRFMVSEEQLIEREVRTMDSKPVLEFFRGKTVMVTGAGGSIGSELVRQIVRASPKKILMVERGEHALYEIDRELRELGLSVPAQPLLVDVCDLERMEEIFAAEKPEVVIHAAAYKHVPMVELNPREGERNNAVATADFAALAKRSGVRRFVLISTDKAVNPVSVMGKTKLAAENAIMALNCPASNSRTHTSFAAVRFGNVIGSSGSVVPLFREQIAKRRPVTVTHPEMKRYFMTVSEAVGLVLQAASRSENAVYTLDMGRPVRILDLAEEMIRQAGLKPYVDIPIVFTGIRPGEKLFEELDVSEKSCYKTDMARVYITKK